MKEGENKIMAESQMKLEILRKINEVGPMGEMESWRSVYPEIWTESVHWERTSVEERLEFLLSKVR